MYEHLERTQVLIERERSKRPCSLITHFFWFRPLRSRESKGAFGRLGPWGFKRKSESHLLVLIKGNLGLSF